MQLSTIALDRLHPHPANANVMPADLLAKLKGHLSRTGRYPPVIVRPHPREAGAYQVLDGHHRVRAMRELGWTQARCLVWAVDDAEALVLLTTLNQLRGQDDPKKRAALVTTLSHLMPIDQLVRQLPEDQADVLRLMELHAPPPARQPMDLGDMPVAVHFFLRPTDRDALESRLRQIGGPREAALMRLVRDEHP